MFVITMQTESCVIIDVVLFFVWKVVEYLHVKHILTLQRIGIVHLHQLNWSADGCQQRAKPRPPAVIAVSLVAKRGSTDIAGGFKGWETSARPLANASENLAGQVENRPGQVEFCIGYIRDCPVRVNAKKI